VGARSIEVVFENWNWGFVRIGSKNVWSEVHCFGGWVSNRGLDDGSGVRWLDYKLSVRKSNDRDRESAGHSSNAYTGCTSILSLLMSSSNVFNFRIE
jgi:hypothetical protein